MFYQSRSPHQYQALPEDEMQPAASVKKGFPQRRRDLYLLTSICLLALNILWSSWLFTQTKRAEESVSEFAGLKRNISRQWTLNQPDNQTHWEHIWAEQTPYDAGVLALDDSYARAKGLPRAQRWPWDANKGIYLLNAYHNLHCIKNIRTSIEEYRSSKIQSVPWAHVQHCLLVLRDDVMCNADDTPRYSGFQPSHNSGTGQVRRCRDWKALESWAMEPARSGCWKHIDGKGITDFSEIDRYRFCPVDSVYREISQSP